MIKPVMSAAVEAEVNDALAQFRNRDKWILWGMNLIREQGPCVLLKGPPGTGKTTIARYMSKIVKKGFKQLSVANIGGGTPGSTEKAVIDFFLEARQRHNMTVFIDEADHLLGRRSEIKGDALTWMLGTIETLMMEMNKYKGLVICATNHAEKLDPALSDRFLAIINVTTPDIKMRVKLWTQKWPENMPYHPSVSDIDSFAAKELNGRQIETVIINTAARAIREERKPCAKLVHEFISKELAKMKALQ